MPTYPFPTTSLIAVPTGGTFAGSNLFVATAGGAVQQVPVSLLPNSPLFRNVMSYGATGDGSTDDTTAIAAAFTGTPVGTTIVFPPGFTFKMTSYVSVNANRVTVVGTGAKIISGGSGQDRKFNVASKYGVSFIDMTIDGGAYTSLADATAFDTYSPQTNPGTIHFVDCTSCKVSRANISGVNWPITLLGACVDIKISECSFAGYYAGIYSYFSGSTGPAPLRVSISDNTFFPGNRQTIPTVASGSPRSSTVHDVWCSGAIKFRGTPLAAAEYTPYWLSIVGNNIDNAGQMGIELQGVNDCSVVGNMIMSGALGISLSYARRISVAANTIRNMIYTGIEVDGRTDGTFVEPSTDIISLTGNSIDSRDEFGRSTDWVNNYGIVISNVALNVSVSGGSIKFCKTAIAVTSHSHKTLISGVKITTNEQSDYGGIAGFDTSQGILVHTADHVDIIGCSLEPSEFNNWQRMVNIIESSYVTVRDCTIVANNCPVYIHDSSEVHVENNMLHMGSAVVGGSAGSAFVGVDATESNCSNIWVRNNTFKGSTTYGVNLYAPANTISGVYIDGNDTRFASVGAASMVTKSTSGSGAVSNLVVGRNYGPGDADPQHNIAVPVLLLTGTIADSSQYETILAEFTATINLQSAVGCNGKIKRIISVSPFSTVTIHPVSGQSISGSTSDITITTQWGKVTLISDGANWHNIG